MRERRVRTERGGGGRLEAGFRGGGCQRRRRRPWHRIEIAITVARVRATVLVSGNE